MAVSRTDRDEAGAPGARGESAPGAFPRGDRGRAMRSDRAVSGAGMSGAPIALLDATVPVGGTVPAGRIPGIASGGIVAVILVLPVILLLAGAGSF